MTVFSSNSQSFPRARNWVLLVCGLAVRLRVQIGVGEDDTPGGPPCRGDATLKQLSTLAEQSPQGQAGFRTDTWWTGGERAHFGLFFLLSGLKTLAIICKTCRRRLWQVERSRLARVWDTRVNTRSTPSHGELEPPLPPAVQRATPTMGCQQRLHAEPRLLPLPVRNTAGYPFSDT